MQAVEIILASQSPRRRELMTKIGIPFEVITSEAEENTKEILPENVVKDLSHIKAKAVLEKRKSMCPARPVVVIGADTIVSVNREILGKPQTERDAYEMISKLQGIQHQVYTGVTIMMYEPDSGRTTVKTFAEKTDVKVCAMTPKEIAEYISCGECMDKAGAYGIQGKFGIYIEKINGDYHNVVGLPIARVYHTLKELLEKSGGKWGKTP